MFLGAFDKKLPFCAVQLLIEPLPGLLIVLSERKPLSTVPNFVPVSKLDHCLVPVVGLILYTLHFLKDLIILVSFKDMKFWLLEQESNSAITEY